MKKTMFLSLALGLATAAPVMAVNYDLYISGSTAFRVNAHDACGKLFDTIQTGNNGTGAAASSDSRWTMTGTCVNSGLTSGSDTLTIHALWTGSVQGLSAMLNKDQLVFLASGANGNPTLVTNSSSLAFSDVFSSPTLDPLPSGSFTETKVAVQPFVFVRSKGPGGVQSINNVTWQQLNTLLGASGGSAPLSYFTGNQNDHGTNIYLVHRSLDSGTRVTTVQEAQYVGSILVNYYDSVGDAYSPATTNMGPAAFGPGYVGGGDVKTVLNFANPGNQAIGYLSFADAKGVGPANWANMLAFNGQYPILNYTNGITAPTTNDFQPVYTGKYSFWAFEIIASPKTGQWGTYTDQNLSFSQLTAIINKLKGTGVGSIDNEIANSGSARTAIRLSEMQVSRPAVGGVISP
ncbi:MAG: hypothetical protein P4N60_16940 [Verrucomicrobiae bacterium]|nr:hypothetical protein [Verrucomicrobiae bacterium]